MRLPAPLVINAELNRSARRDALRFYVLVTAMVLLFDGLRCATSATCRSCWLC